jgi:hypothetical protein
MAAEGKSKEPITLTLSHEEAVELAQLVESALGDTHVELRHTQTPGYRERVRHSEALLRELLSKLQRLLS